MPDRKTRKTPADDCPIMNETNGVETPLIGTDQFEEQPNWWSGDMSPHRPYERGLIGSVTRRLRHWLAARHGADSAAPQPGR